MAETVLTEAPSATVFDPRRVSPAAHLAERFEAAEVTGPRGVALREVPFEAMIGLRAAPGTAAADRLESRLGTGLPTSCGAVSVREAVSVLWLAPDEFLVVAGQERGVSAEDLVDALGSAPGSACDLSANRTTFELSGPSAREVLEKGCPLDLHPRSFAVGAAYLTSVGSVSVILWRTANQTYRLMPRSSFADFLGRWLIDAMIEYAAPELS